MGFSTWHEYGYGIKTTNITTESVERLRELLKLAPKLNASIESYLRLTGITEPSWDDYMEYDADCMCGLATILAEFLLEVEDISFTACSDWDGDIYLIYTPSYPWNIRESEKGLTTTKLFKILQKYVGMLTNEFVNIDFWEVENGG